MKTDELLQWFTEELLPSLIESGKFSEKSEKLTLESCEFEGIEKYVNSFASVPSFAKLKLNGQSGPVVIDILIKFQHQNPLFREKMRSVAQYKNEALFYNEAVPCFAEFLKSCGHTTDILGEIAPKCYFASDGGDDPEKGIVILEDLRKKGFRVSDAVTDLDLDHCLLPLEKLAKFHALSFAMKFKNWEPFEKLKILFEDIWVQDNPQCREMADDYLPYIAQRGIDHLLETGEVPRDYLENITKVLKHTFDYEIWVRAPIEPLAVIRHGDFNRNNLLYRYNKEQVVDTILLDFQTTTYGPPAIDYGFLIYLNTTPEFREKHFDQLFEHYYNTLIKTISGIINEDEKSISDRIPIQSFKDEFAKVALFHYLTLSFFLPYMMTPPDPDFEDDMLYKTLKESAIKNRQKGGEDVTKRIADVLVEFYRRKFHLKFLK